MTEKEFDDIFRSLGEHTETPSEGTWRNIERKMGRRRTFTILKWSGAACTAAAAVIVAFMLLRHGVSEQEGIRVVSREEFENIAEAGKNVAGSGTNVAEPGTNVAEPGTSETEENISGENAGATGSDAIAGGDAISARIQSSAHSHTVAAVSDDGNGLLPETCHETVGEILPASEADTKADGESGFEESAAGNADTVSETENAGNTYTIDWSDFTENAEDGQVPDDAVQGNHSGNEGISTAWRPASDDIHSRQGKKSGMVLDIGSTAEAGTFANGIVSPANTRYMRKMNSFRVDPNINKRDTVLERKTGKYSVPVSVGISAKIRLSERFDLGIGVNYTVMSRKLAGEFNGNYYSDIRNIQQYVGIPLSIYFNIVQSKRVAFYVQAGGAVERSISDQYRMTEANNNVITHREPAKGVQLSVSAGIGIEYWFTDFIGIYLDPTLRYYFDNYQAKSIRTDQPLQTGFELGMRFRF